MPADIVVGTDTKDDDHGFDEKAGDFRKIATLGADVVILIIGKVFEEVTGIGAITWLLGKANNANRSNMDASLDQYLHAVTGSIGKEANRLTETIDKGFKELDKKLEETFYKLVVHDRAMLIASHMKEVIAATTEKKTTEQIELAIKEFIDQCDKMPPIDVLYTMYKRISKSRSDLNFIWSALIDSDYHHATFEPYKKQVQETMVSLVLSHIMYISLTYEKERDAENADSVDDEDEIERLFAIARDINQCLNDIDTQRREVWWPKIPEQIVRREIPKGTNDGGKTAEERIIFNLMKNFGPWYDFVAIEFTPVTSDRNDSRYDWKLDSHEQVKNFEIDVGGTKCIVLRFERSVAIKGNNEFILKDIGDQLGTFHKVDHDTSLETTLDQTLEHFKKLDKSQPWFTLAIRYRPEQGGWAGNIGNQKLNWQATNQFRLIHRTYTPQYQTHVPFEFGQIAQIWTNNYEVFISNTR